jgi:hypothetical protein
MQSSLNQKNRKELLQRGKTRIESLKNRIDIAFETLKNIYDESKLEKISQKKKEQKKITSEVKTIQYDLEEVANKIVSKEGEPNLKTLDTIINKENLEESSQKGQDIEVVSPFVRRMQFIINELNQLKTNSNIDENELDKEVSELPKRGLIELSLSKIKLNRKHEKLINSDKDKNEYVKKLENEIVTQRLSLEELKKAEGEHLLQISTLEDQIRILKSKVFGYDISKKYEYYKEHESANGPSAHIQDENLAYSMWEKENYAERKAPTKLNKLENEKQMWIANTQNNINKLENDVKIANSYRAGNNFGINNDEDNGLWTKTPEQARNRNGNNGFNNYGAGYKRYDGGNNQGNSLGNMRRVTPMIMNNKKKY